MKLNIAFNKELSGYTNIDISKQPIDLGNLDSVCGPSECTEIILDKVLNYIPFRNIGKALEHICSKMRLRGRMIIIFHDVSSIIRKYFIAEINEEELNLALFGLGYRSAFSYDHITEILPPTVGVSSITTLDGQVTIVLERKNG